MTKMTKITINDIYKKNLIKLVSHHRIYCLGEDCNVSLILVLEMAQKLGIKFTDEEKRLFF